jgi:hypothetical protein
MAFFSLAGIQPRHNFVDKQQLRRRGQSPGELQHAQFIERQIPGQNIALAEETDKLEIVRGIVHRVLKTLMDSPLAGNGAGQNAGKRGQLRKRPGNLIGARKPHVRPLIGLHPRDVHAVHLNFSRSGKKRAVRQFTTVDLPAPLGPMNPRSRPCKPQTTRR